MVSTAFSFAQHRYPTLRGNPCSAVETVDERRTDLPILRRVEMEDWRKRVERWALLFRLLSELRRGSEEARVGAPLTADLEITRHSNSRPKGGEEKSLDLILSRPMLCVLWHARRASRKLHPQHADSIRRFLNRRAATVRTITSATARWACCSSPSRKQSARIS
jgi:hypothetical protein